MAVNPIREGFHTVTPYLNEGHVMTEKKVWLRMHGRWSRLRRRHRQGRLGSRTRRCRRPAVMLQGSQPRWATTTTCWQSNSTSPARRMRRRQLRPLSRSSARIDILVNNAGNFFAGFFEELSLEQVRNQIETLLFGSMNVTRAILPVMRKQRFGLLLAISSTAGIAGQMFCTAYAAAKFGIEGWMESLYSRNGDIRNPHDAPSSPGFFRTELLTKRLDDLRQAHNRRLRRTNKGDCRCLEDHGWEAKGRPCQARRRAR